jgi:hypothetical protein
MKHLIYLRDIANYDVEHILEKEKTYKGSWKKRGGVGAWMMAARKIDRIEEMMKVRQHDIFKDPGDGHDGTPLAEIRDLRRYLLLIESELIAQGQIYIDSIPSSQDDLFRPGTPDDGGHHARQVEYDLNEEVVEFDLTNDRKIGW